jgi:hypothetical protein
MHLVPQSSHQGTLDGAGAADHDRPFEFGKRPCTSQPFPFTTCQYARLLVLRSRSQDGLVVGETGTTPDLRIRLARTSTRSGPRPAA